MSNFKEFVIGEITKNIHTNEEYARFWRENHCNIEGCKENYSIKACKRCKKYVCRDHSARNGNNLLLSSHTIVVCVRCLTILFEIEKNLERLKSNK